EIASDVLAAELSRERIALIDDTADSDVSAARIAVRHVLEVTVGIRIVQGPVLAERLPVVAALDTMQHVNAAVVRTIEEVTVLVEIEAPRVAAPLAEQLELVRDRMITPNTLLEFDAADVRRHRAPLAAIKPAVRSPRQRVCHRMRV